MFELNFQRTDLLIERGTYCVLPRLSETETLPDEA